MSRPPDFDELMEGIDGPEDRERLRRVHELLIQAGPPPELSPQLASAPAPKKQRRTRRRLMGGLALAGAVVAATFGIGYLAGASGDDDEPDVATRDTIALVSRGSASGEIDLGFKQADGNWPMAVTVSGLEPLGGGDYYTLALTKDGDPKVTCGTFNVGHGRRNTIRMSAAYNLEGFDGWVVLHYDAQTHKDTPVLWTTRRA